ncbi:head-tail adaptor protein [Brevundimonas phoenicis]|jgi:SPP1 family predicted phage head-tail adaptor
MKLGDFDHPIAIRRWGDTGQRDSFNAPIMGWMPVATGMAQRVQSSGREYLAADAIQTTLRVVFRTHWIPGLTTKDHVLCNGIDHNIREVRPLGRNRYVELHAEVTA